MTEVSVSRIPSTARTWEVSEESSPDDVVSEPTEEDETLQQYNLIGVLMGLAVYNSNILDLHFPSVCYQKLLSPPVVPHADMHLGVVRNPSLDDLAQIMPDVARGMRELLAYQGDVEHDMCLTFQASIEEFGAVKTFPLKQGGEDVPVTNQNRKEYVRLYLDWMLNTAIYNEFRSFYLGFHAVCASNALIVSVAYYRIKVHQSHRHESRTRNISVLSFRHSCDMAVVGSNTDGCSARVSDAAARGGGDARVRLPALRPRGPEESYGVRRLPAKR